MPLPTFSPLLLSSSYHASTCCNSLTYFDLYSSHATNNSALYTLFIPYCFTRNALQFLVHPSLPLFVLISVSGSCFIRITLFVLPFPPRLLPSSAFFLALLLTLASSLDCSRACSFALLTSCLLALLADCSLYLSLALVCSRLLAHTRSHDLLIDCSHACLYALFSLAC